MKYGSHLMDFVTNPILVLVAFIVLLASMDLLLEHRFPSSITIRAR